MTPNQEILFHKLDRCETTYQNLVEMYGRSTGAIWSHYMRWRKRNDKILSEPMDNSFKPKQAYYDNEWMYGEFMPKYDYDDVKKELK
jgi:hypothetical protein